MLAINQKLNPSKILFRKIEDSEIQAQIDKLNKQSGRKKMEGQEKLESKPEITIEDFQKLDLRVAEVLAVDVPEKAKRLYRLKIKIGDEERQIMSSIKEYYNPDELVGKKIVIVYNLKPATLAGELSEGMLLAASTSDKSILFLVDPGDIPSGARVN